MTVEVHFRNDEKMCYNSIDVVFVKLIKGKQFLHIHELRRDIIIPVDVIQYWGIEKDEADLDVTWSDP